MKLWKKLLLAVGGLLFAFVLFWGVAFSMAFSGSLAAEDKAVFAEGKVVTVLDGFVSCFLVDLQVDGQWALVDACMDPKAVAIKAALAERGLGPEAVSVILLTHGHSDHIGGVAAFPNAQVRALPQELPNLSGQVGYKSPIGRMTGRNDSGIRIEKPLQLGREKIGNTIVETFHLPGHTAGSAAFLMHGVLFWGDSAASTNEHKIKASPWVFSEDCPVNKAAVQALAKQLADRSPAITTMVFAHSGALLGNDALRDFAQ